MDECSLALSNIVIADAASSGRCARRTKEGKLVRVFRNAFVVADYLAVRDRWERTRRVNLVRACAVSLVLGPGAVLSHETAAAIHGMRMVGHLVDVHVSIGRRWGGSTGQLPALSLPDGSMVPSVRLVRHETAVPTSRVLRARGLAVSSLLDTAVQCACSMHPRESMVIVSGALRMLSEFDRFRMEESRGRELLWRTRMSEVLEGGGPRQRHRKRAREVIAAADAGCESVPEVLLLWALKAAGFVGVRTQVAHQARSAVYFVDVEIDGTGAVIEFDGKIKYGEDREGVLEKLSQQNRRQKDLESLGLLVIRFEYQELTNWQAIRDEVVARCRLPRMPRPNKILLGGY